MGKISFFGDSSKRMDDIAAKLDEVLNKISQKRVVQDSWSLTILHRLEHIDSTLSVIHDYCINTNNKLDTLTNSLSQVFTNSNLFESETMLIKEAEVYSGLKEDTLRKYVANGKLEAAERSNNKTKIRIYKWSLDKYLGIANNSTNTEEVCGTQDNQ